MSNYVLVVDDNPSDALINAAYVEKEGFIPVVASNGFEAIDKLENMEFKLFMIDLQMPQMNGIELIKRLKRIESQKNVPVLVTSARKELKDVQLAVQAGAKDYIVKPLDGEIFKEKFARLTGGAVKWAEYGIREESPLSAGFFRHELKIISISEVGLTVMSCSAVEPGTTLEIGGALMGSKESVSAAVHECAEADGRYELKLSFVGLTDKKRSHIRSVCQELWRAQNA